MCKIAYNPSARGKGGHPFFVQAQATQHHRALAFFIDPAKKRETATLLSHTQKDRRQGAGNYPLVYYILTTIILSSSTPLLHHLQTGNNFRVMCVAIQAEKHLGWVKSYSVS